MDSPDLKPSQIAAMVLTVGAVSAITYFSGQWMFSLLDPHCKVRKRAKKVAEEQLRKLNSAPGGEERKFRTQDLNEHEVMIAALLVAPEDINVSWADIAGLDAVVNELRESVVLPVRHRDLFYRSQLCQAPKGILLHGPPGCGKTLIAKAIAKDAGMRFINLDVSVLKDKWYGESLKLASAVFTLAEKLEPCIIFIDEIESFLRVRGIGDHEATAMMKTQFMIRWDGLITNDNACILVLGATNRPQDLDKAILRRMSLQFYIEAPQDCQRHEILQLILQSEQLHPSVNLKELARLATGFSGSDLRELCRHAFIYRMRQTIRERDGSGLEETENEGEFKECQQLEIHMDDLLKSLMTMKVSKFQSLSADKDLELD
ncbi:hypothetical protein KR054_003282 [Drosophila jambulina]|nr:hypothetical protein KR054_003282 [Drosophila jambulina]